MEIKQKTSLYPPWGREGHPGFTAGHPNVWMGKMGRRCITAPISVSPLRVFVPTHGPV